MNILILLVALSGLLLISFLLGRHTMKHAWLAGYHSGRKVSMWRAPNIRFTGRALVPASRRVD